MTRLLARSSVRAMRRGLSNFVFSDKWFIAYYDKHPTLHQCPSVRILSPPAYSNYADTFLYEKVRKALHLF